MDLNTVKVGMLGFGNMGQALVQGWLKTGALTGEQIYASAHNQDKLQANTDKFGIQAVVSNTALVTSSDIVVLAVKPHMISAVVEEVGDALSGKIVVSLAVGLYASDYADIIKTDTEVLSILPNTPVSVGEGAVIFEKAHTMNDENYALVKELFETISVVSEVPVEQMDAAGIISGCGPAFMAMVIEALADGGVKYGLSRDVAYELASQTLVGTGKLQLETGLHPGQMKDQVTSPGGTTIKGVTALEAHGMRDAFISTFDAILNN